MALALFAFSFFFLCGGRIPGLPLDRTGGVTLGAVAMVATGVVPREAVYREAVDFDTLVLLLGMMVMTAYLEAARFFTWAGAMTLRLARTPTGLLWGICAVSGLLSALLVNDTVCLLFTPLVLEVVLAAGLSPLPYLLSISMAANAGSAATLTGNPQNMIVGQLSGIAYGRFAALSVLPAVAAVLVTAAVLHLSFRKQLATERFTPPAKLPELDRGLLLRCGLVLGGVVIGFFAGLPLAWTAMGGACALFVLGKGEPRAMVEKVDAALLVFFAALFVVVHGIERSGLAARALEAALPHLEGSLLHQTTVFSGITLVGSNLFSNVPFVLLVGRWVPKLAHPETTWCVLALVSTLAGNLTVVGSVANIIVLERARDRVQVSFVEYLRVGVPATLLSIAVGVALLLLVTGS